MVWSILLPQYNVQWYIVLALALSLAASGASGESGGSGGSGSSGRIVPKMKRSKADSGFAFNSSEAYFIRHGESVANVTKRKAWFGQIRQLFVSDPLLTRKGVCQARMIAGLLVRRIWHNKQLLLRLPRWPRFQYAVRHDSRRHNLELRNGRILVFTSPLKRAILTAITFCLNVAAPFGMQNQWCVVVMPGLSEVTTGLSGLNDSPTMTIKELFMSNPMISSCHQNSQLLFPGYDRTTLINDKRTGRPREEIYDMYDEEGNLLDNSTPFNEALNQLFDNFSDSGFAAEESDCRRRRCLIIAVTHAKRVMRETGLRVENGQAVYSMYQRRGFCSMTSRFTPESLQADGTFIEERNTCSNIFNTEDSDRNIEIAEQEMRPHV